MEDVLNLLREVMRRIGELAHRESLLARHNTYYVDGVKLTEIIEETYPARGEEVCIDGVYYVVVNPIRHVTMCPPWRTNVHLRLADDQDTAR